jgi:acetylglutamate kinase
MRMQVIVYKIGGRITDDPNLLEQAVKLVAGTPRAILVHGGGEQVSAMSKRLGVQTRMIEGRRITDRQTLDIAVMVFGLINKRLVAALTARGKKAIGMSGPDADLIRARKRPVGKVDFGFVGDIEQVNSEVLEPYLKLRWCPVICPVTHDGAGQLLNTNADTMAAEIAVALADRHQVTLALLMAKDGVLENEADPSSTLKELTIQDADRLKTSGILNSGIIPKVDNGMNAIRRGVHQVIIGSPDSFRKNTATTLIEK